MDDSERGIFLELPSAAGQPVLHPATPIGKTVECQGASLSTTSLHFEFDQRLTVYYYRRNEFMKRPVKVESVDDSGDTIVLEFSHTGEESSAEKRQMYRVSAIMADIVVGLEEEPSCELIDLSVMGCSVMATKKYEIGQMLELRLEHEEYRASGQVIVSGSLPLRRGKTRYGLSVTVNSQTNGQLTTLLSKMTTNLERIQLKRLARC